jgi:sulfide:quinone oxidoreductase
MDKGKSILVLGGGVGGLVTAVELRKKLPKHHQIALIDREPEHVFAPSLLWLMVGLRDAKRISRPLERLRRKGIDVIHGEIERIDPESRRVTAGGKEFSCDYLVVSLGADLAPQTVPGLSEAGHNLYTLDGAQALRKALETFTGNRVVVLTAAPAYKCPAAPYEAAMLIDSYLRRRKTAEQAHVDIYAAEPGPMRTAGLELSKAFEQLVTGKGITYHPEHQVVSVDPQARRIRFANGVEAEFDLLAYVPPHRAPRVVKESGLADESGWVPVDRQTMQTRFTDVYAVGDVTTILLKMGKPLPKAGVFAHAQAEVVVQNIAHALTGKGSPATFDGAGECFIETGGGKAGAGRGNFYAEPTPVVNLHPAAWKWHAAKVLFEKFWLWKWF